MSKRFRGGGRRRGCLGCGAIVFGGVVLLIIVGIIVDPGTKSPPADNVFGNTMSQEKYEAAAMKSQQGAVLTRIGNVGAPENLAKPSITRLFPGHRDNRVCNYWQITDRKQTVARLCFADPQGGLVQKLERRLPSA